jgi:hypothetical protein
MYFQYYGKPMGSINAKTRWFLAIGCMDHSWNSNRATGLIFERGSGVYPGEGIVRDGVYGSDARGDFPFFLFCG